MDSFSETASAERHTGGMLAKLKTFSMQGINAMPVEVEVDVSARAMPKTILVGLPEAAVRESTHRVERAMINSGFVRPADRIVINLAPDFVRHPDRQRTNRFRSTQGLCRCR